MNRKIKVKNFITLKEAIYEPKRFNVIIGQQAVGKSLLVKLDYFLNEVIENILYKAVVEEYRKNEFIKEIKQLFSKYFNKNIWKNYSFEIEFFFEQNYEILIRKGKRNLEVLINKDLDNFRKKLLSEFRKFKTKKKDSFFIEIDFFVEYLKKNYQQIFKDSIFIPAGRSYFANMDRNIYMILEKNYRIDPFLIIFGSRFENAKNMLEAGADIVKINDSKINQIIKNILKGNIEYSKELENIGIKRDKVFTEIYYASSGQQESLPLLLILSVLLGQKEFYSEIYVEEPEAHLFPASQKAMIELLGYIYNQNYNITITTHSPYIITSINNQLLINEMKDKISKKSYLYEFLDYGLDIETLRAYSIEEGVLKNIVNRESKLIEGYTIDNISDEFSRIFDDLLELEE